MKNFLIILSALLASIVFLYALLWLSDFKSKPKQNMLLGVSFSPDYAEYLGLNPRKVYAAILDEWNFRHLRLSAPWDAIEGVRGQYNFSGMDYWMDEAAGRGAKVILVVGRKTPRWPECHLPQWVKDKEYGEYKADFLNYVSRVVERYKNHPALEVWQVENEPFLPFGLCGVMSGKDLTEEVAAVRGLDDRHPVMITDSGELSLWFRTARAGDLFGTTMYRVVWNRFIGYWSYGWLPSSFYRFRLWMNRVLPPRAFIVELQAEPWIAHGNIFNVSLEEQFKSMNLERLRGHISYAQKTGLPRAYLWGAEWWYWLKEQGVDDFADYIKDLEK